VSSARPVEEFKAITTVDQTFHRSQGIRRHWNTFKLRARGRSVQLSFDGKQLYTAQDNTFAGAGRVGLRTKADSATYFDTIAITPLE
jgi:hypothetical protein